MNAVFFDLNTLFPDFSLAFDSTSSDSITASFVVVMFLILIISAAYAFYRFIGVHQIINYYKRIINGLTQDQLAEKREEICKTVEKTKFGKLWKDFDSSLVYSIDGKILLNTLSADYFFNENSLARSLSGNRLLASIPALLTGIGVLGTFAGLQLGLASLDLTADSDVNVLKSSIFSMMSGASTAFVTSVWGVSLSLLFNLFEKLLERNVRRKIAFFQDHIDNLFPKITTEQTLINISDTSKITSQTMQTLAEQIGDRLQQSLMQASDSIRQGMNDNLLAVQQSMAAISDNMREGLEKGMHEILKPAIESITQSAQNSSGDMVRTLVSQFMDGVHKAGSGQQEALEKAASNVQSAVNGMASQMGSIMQALELHGKAAHENSQEAINSIAQALQNSQAAFEERSKLLYNEFNQQFATVSDASTQSVVEMKEILSQIIERNSEQQKISESRFNDIVNNIETMIETVSTKSQEIDEVRSKSLEQQLNHITSVMESKITGFEEVVSNISEAQTERDSKRQEAFSNSVLEMRQSQDSLLEKLKELSTSFASVSEQINELASSHEHLSKNVLNAAENLSTASISLGSLGLNLNTASGKIENGATLLESGARETSGVIKESTMLARECASNLQKSLTTIDHIEHQISETAKTMNATVSSSRDGFEKIKTDLEVFASELLKISAQHASSFDSYLENIAKRSQKMFEELANELRIQQNTISEDVQDKYVEFSKDVEKLLQNFSQQTQSQINSRLNDWNAHTSEYTKTMTDAIKVLASVVDEIDTKVGKA